MKNTKTLLIPAVLILTVVLLSVVSASSVAVFLFYDATNSSSLTIVNGDSTNIMVSANSIFENSMTLKLDLLDVNGSVVSNILNVYTASDSYSKYFAVGKAAYLDSGNYTIRAIVTGESGQTDTDTLHLEVLAVTPGNNLPVITSTPVTQVNETKPYSYQVTATDADGDTLTYSLTQNPSWLSINSAGLITGIAPNVTSDYPYDVTVRISDGKDFVTQTFSVIVKDTNQAGDTTPPFLTIGSPSDGTIYTSNSFKFAIDTNEPASRVWYVLLSNLAEVNMTETTSNHFEKNVTLSDGSYEIIFYARDLAGNVGSSNVINFVVSGAAGDTIPPVITVVSPVDSMAYGYSNINFEITSNEALSNAMFSLDGAVNVSLDSITSTDFAKTIAVGNGNHNLVFYAQDLAGNVGESTVNFFVNALVPDVTPPNVEIFTPENGQTFSSYYVTLFYRASDINLDRCLLGTNNASYNVTIPCNVPVSWIAPVDGINIWTVYATDLAGNLGSQTVTFYVNIPSGGEGAGTGGTGHKKVISVSNTDDNKKYLDQFSPLTIDDTQVLGAVGQATFWQEYWALVVLPAIILITLAVILWKRR